MPTSSSPFVVLSAGTLGGMSAVVVGHPFDTVKTRVQISPHLYRGALDCARQTFSAEGMSGLYRGWQSPMLGMGAFSALMFYGNAAARSLLAHEDGTVSVGASFVAGGVGGATGALLSTPQDFIKVQMQAVGSTYASTWECFKHVVRTRGVLAVYQGFGATMGREVPGLAAYFGTNHVVKQALLPAGGSMEDLSFGRSLLAGGLAGLACWVACFPMDVVKSALQADDPAPERRKYRGYWHCVRELWKEGGPARFSRGLSAALARSVPANAACFVVYDKVVLAMTTAS